MESGGVGVISDHGWDTILALLSPIVSVIVSVIGAHYARSANKQAKVNASKTDQLMQQTMRAFLIQVLTGQLDMPIESFTKLYHAYYEAGGNGEIRDLAVAYLALKNKEDNNE